MHVKQWMLLLLEFRPPPDEPDAAAGGGVADHLRRRGRGGGGRMVQLKVLRGRGRVAVKVRRWNLGRRGPHLVVVMEPQLGMGLRLAVCRGGCGVGVSVGNEYPVPPHHGSALHRLLLGGRRRRRVMVVLLMVVMPSIVVVVSPTVVRLAPAPPASVVHLLVFVLFLRPTIPVVRGRGRRRGRSDGGGGGRPSMH